MSNTQTVVTIYRGDSLDGTVFPYTDSNGNPASLAGYTAYMTIRDFFGNQIASLSSPSNGITVTNSSGLITPFISGSNTAAMPIGVHKFDVYISNSTHSQTIIPDGLFQITKSNTFYGS